MNIHGSMCQIRVVAMTGGIRLEPRLVRLCMLVIMILERFPCVSKEHILDELNFKSQPLI